MSISSNFLYLIVADLSQVEAGRRNGRFDYEDRVGRQVRFELGVVDVLRLLDLAAVLALAAAFLVVARGSHDDPVPVRRHPDALRIAAEHVEA